MFQILAFRRNSLEWSNNPWHRKLVKTARILPSNKNDQSAKFDLFKKILTDGNDVTIVNDMKLREWLKMNPEFQDLKYHFGKEVLANSDILVWGVQRNSPWLEALNQHILTLDQAIIIYMAIQLYILYKLLTRGGGFH